MKIKSLAIFLLFLNSCTRSDTYVKEVQLTNDNTKNHDLDNNDNFSPDGKWLVFDTRTGIGGLGGSPSVERVNVETGKIEVIFAVPDNRDWGPGAGAVSYHPFENKVIFIHGLEVCTEKNPYQQWRRTGVIVDVDHPNMAINMDSRDITPPFTIGALRGGTHRHEWSRDGKWVGYTYNDAIMKRLEDSTKVKWNLRTIAVSTQKHKMPFNADNPDETVNGNWFSTVVVRVVQNPQPGTDEISNAASDSWIGVSGYKKPDGKLQVARAFTGKVVSKSGNPVDELFVVDIPDSINVPGEYGPLEGTLTTFPMPPKGTVQRRLTYTAESNFPGVGGVTRSSFDGSRIAFLMRDKNGIQQIFTLSPLGGKPAQVTYHTTDVQGNPRWRFDNLEIAYIWDNSIATCTVSEQPFEKRFKRLTAKTKDEPSNIVWANDGKTIGFNRSVQVEGKKDGVKQIFIIKL